MVEQSVCVRGNGVAAPRDNLVRPDDDDICSELRGQPFAALGGHRHASVRGGAYQGIGGAVSGDDREARPD
jgi:hypothetical protein